MIYFWLTTLIISATTALICAAFTATAVQVEWEEFARHNAIIFLPLLFLALTAACVWATLTSYNSLKAEWTDQHPAAVIEPHTTSGKTVT